MTPLLRDHKFLNAKCHKTIDQFAIARVVLLLCSSRSPKSCSFHVEKVIVFSLFLAICFYHVIIINLGGLHFGTTTRQV